MRSQGCYGNIIMRLTSLDGIKREVEMCITVLCGLTNSNNRFGEKIL